MSEKRFRRKAPGIMRDLLRDFPQLALEDTAAILGNIGGETGGFALMQEAKPLVAGSRGGWGWCQWTGPRRRAFERWAQERGLAFDSDDANYGFLVHELQTTERRAIPAVLRAKDLAAKVIAFERSFERAGIPHHKSRIRWAEMALDAYQTMFSAEPQTPFDRQPDDPGVSNELPKQDELPAPPPAQPQRPSLLRRVWNWITSGAVGGGLFYMDWRLFVAASVLLILLIAFLLWLFGREPIKQWLKRNFA